MSIKALYDEGTFCDTVLVVGGQNFKVHRAVLAAQSTGLREYLKNVATPARKAKDSDPTVTENPPVAQTGADKGVAAGQPPVSTPDQAAQSSEREVEAKQEAPLVEVQVDGISHPQAMQVTLDYIYASGTGSPWCYDPVTMEVNWDVLALTERFDLPFLHEEAARWLAKGLTTENIVKRLAACKAFKLHGLRQKIVEQLTALPHALNAVSSSQEIQEHPSLLQELLLQVASMCRARSAAANVVSASDGSDVGSSPSSTAKDSPSGSSSSAAVSVPVQATGKTVKAEPVDKAVEKVASSSSSSSSALEKKRSSASLLEKEKPAGGVTYKKVKRAVSAA
jgi:hypothetical protein